MIDLSPPRRAVEPASVLVPPVGDAIVVIVAVAAIADTVVVIIPVAAVPNPIVIITFEAAQGRNSES